MKQNVSLLPQGLGTTQYNLSGKELNCFQEGRSTSWRKDTSTTAPVMNHTLQTCNRTPSHLLPGAEHVTRHDLSRSSHLLHNFYKGCTYITDTCRLNQRSPGLTNTNPAVWAECMLRPSHTSKTALTLEQFVSLVDSSDFYSSNTLPCSNTDPQTTPSIRSACYSCPCKALI